MAPRHSPLLWGRAPMLSVLVTALSVTVLVPLPDHARAAVAGQVYGRPADGVYDLTGRGYGHGRGMSQYGARGAATRGLSHQQILDFYYPSTTAGSLGQPEVRVWLTRDERYDTVVVPDGGAMTADDPATAVAAVALPGNVGGAAVDGWRAVRAFEHLWLEGRWGGSWHPYPEGAQLRSSTSLRLSSSTGETRLQLPDGTVSRYRGVMDALNNSAGVLTVNRLPMEQYLRGVVPAEMPATWAAEAVQAQAIAARSYSASLLRPNAAYDLCDTTACQVYSGMAGEHPAADAAIAATRDEVRTYQGSPIFAEFSAANGGWTVASDKPWFVAKEDPYDGVVASAAHAWTDQVTVSEIEQRYPEIGSLRSINVNSRDGNGDWGGRIGSLTLVGSAASRTVSGNDFRFAFGLRSTWWTTDAAPAPPSAVRDVTAVAGDQYAEVTWSAPVSDGGAPVTGYLVYASYAEPPVRVGPEARRAVVSGLSNGSDYRLDVYAVNDAGMSPTSTTNLVTPTGFVGAFHGVDPQRVYDSNGGDGPIGPGQQRRIKVAGLAGVPAGAGAAVLNVTVTQTTATSFLTTWSDPHPRPDASVLNWDGSGQTVATMVHAKLSGDGSVNIYNSSGSAALIVDVLGYFAPATGAADEAHFVASPPSRAFDTATGLGTAPLSFSAAEERTVGLSGVQGEPGHPAVPHGASAVLMNLTADRPSETSFVTVWAAGSTRPATSNLNPAVGVTRANAVVSPINAEREAAVFNNRGSVRLLGDVMGAFVPGSTGGLFRPLLPMRILDTRGGGGGHPGRLGPGEELTLDVSGVGGLPATGASAVALTVTLVAPTEQTFLTAWPTGSTRPNASNVNGMPGTVVPNQVVVPVGQDGTVRLYNSRGSADIVVDVAGWYGS